MTAAELYGDIMGLRRPVHDRDIFSMTHPKMPRGNRAKLFAPFAALSGFEQCISEQELPFEPRRILSGWEKRRLDQTLRALSRIRDAQVEAIFFEPCPERHSGASGQQGIYRRIRGTVHCLNPDDRILRIDDVFIAFDNIYRLKMLERRSA